jgi:DHA1 family bicyclomycin/chloramphenicol resistance-like MFS transporter
MDRNKPVLPYGEFVALMAMMMSLLALSTDAMLPALSDIGKDLGIQRENTNQLIVSLLFLGMAAGQIAYGPLSDSFGRKPAIYAGYGLFIAGCSFSIAAMNFPTMLAGRILQGIGIAGPRSVSLALIRDQYEGRAMARVMSFVMVVLIIVPAIAPTFGQAILIFAHWRAIFGAFLSLAFITVLWFAFRQPETLPTNRRKPFLLNSIFMAIREVCVNRISLGYALCAGLISGAFLGYLNSAQQVFQEQYGLGTQFPLYFGANALSIGSAYFLNARLVMRHGMRLLSKWSLLALSGFSIAFCAFSYVLAGSPPLVALMIYLMTALFCIGILFGNLNAIAMEPLGHIAGVGAAVIGSLSTFISVLLGMLIGQSYNGTILPLVGGFAVLSTISIAIMRWAENSKGVHADTSPRNSKNGLIMPSYSEDGGH